MAFIVNDVVKVQKADMSSPAFDAVVTEVMGGGQYRVRFTAHGPVQNHKVFFKSDVVAEAELTAA